MSDFNIKDGILVKYTGNEAEVVIPDGVTSIGEYPFWGCSRLTRVIIPNSVTSIGASAFYGCISLTGVIIPNSVTSIGVLAFWGCLSLTEVIIPNSVTSISDGAFYECRSLTRIDIPNSVKSIGDEAFRECTSLTEVEIPEGCNIGLGAFLECGALETIVISESDIERLSAPGIFPQPLNQYSIIIKKRAAAVEQFASEARYKQLACQAYDNALRKGIRPVIRFIVPVGYYLIDKLPSDTYLVLQDAESVFRSETYKKSACYLPREVQEHILRSLVAISGKSVCKMIDFQAQSDCMLLI